MLNELKQRSETKLFDSIMPFRLDRSLDKEHGGYFTRLDREGATTPVSYIRLQGRQVWTQSRFYNKGPR
ncbi:MAG: hypothetical protein OXL36_08710 [Bryobacterales bacterium]|nr:hypothetical protein [Bryobacterales bacterium]MDE0293312.1 hypothetical protein [Bryobacterales bacterium]